MEKRIGSAFRRKKNPLVTTVQQGVKHMGLLKSMVLSEFDFPMDYGCQSEVMRSKGREDLYKMGNINQEIVKYSVKQTCHYYKLLRQTHYYLYTLYGMNVSFILWRI